MLDNGIEEFFRIARERYSILLKRNAGLPKPWSEDPVFQNEYFCNIFREDDRTTKWFRENIRDPLNKIPYLDPRIIILAIVAFRWFNKIETWDTILSSGVAVENIFARWDSAWIRQELIDQGSPPWVTGAYIIKTPDGMNKVDGVLWCIDRFINTMEKEKRQFDKFRTSDLSMREACELFKCSPYLGNFMSWQICSDARQTVLLDKARDKDTWAQPGPGSARGLSRVFYGYVDHFKYGSKKDEDEMLVRMNELREYSKDEYYWPQDWPPLAVIDVSHTLCETDKYLRCLEGGRMKRKYNARA
jgi:hypothetical protein